MCPRFAPLIFLFTCLYYPSVSQDCEQQQAYNTKFVSITKGINLESDNFPLYAAVNGTINPSESSISQIFRFVPASYWIPTGQEACDNRVFNYTPSDDGLIRLTEDFLNLSTEQRSNLPDLSLWGDRSVLLFTIRRLRFKPDEDTCPRFSVCPITGLFPDSFLRTLNTSSQICRIPATAATCRERIDSAFHLLYPLAQGVWIEIYDQGKNPARFVDDFQFVLTAAYRLDMGEFECPPNLFACEPSDSELRQEPEPKKDWQVRLCIPRSLHCDHVPNCPSGSDEQNCDKRREPPTRFPKVDGETEQLKSWLSAYDEEVLQKTGRDMTVVLAGPNYMLLMISICLVGLFIILIILLTVFVFIPVSRRSKQRRPPKSNGGKSTTSYEPVSGDSPEPC